MSSPDSSARDHWLWVQETFDFPRLIDYYAGVVIVCL